jgi:hypothetical protein
MSAAVAPRVQALACPSCGGEVVVRSLGHAVNVTCANCGSVLDARHPGLRVLQRFAERTVAAVPKIPLGTRGTLHDTPYEVIGFQVRSITVDGERYAWDEYLLFNPYVGFRYLTEYRGHWNDVITVKALPSEGFSDGRLAAAYDGDLFRHFQRATARTDFVLGEFPWQVRVGDTAEVSDFVAPPRILSSEAAGPDDTTWSLGTYVSAARVWQAFGLPGTPPTAVGVYANQPSPHAATAQGRWSVFAVLLVLLLAVQAVTMFGARNEEVLARSYVLRPPGGEAAAFVTEPFALAGRTSNVELRVDTDVENSWLYLGLALIDAERGTARDFGREIGYYTGYDSEDGSWREGSPRDRVRIPAVPAGRYYLRVAPEAAPGATPIRYTIRVRRDVPSFGYFFVALALLAAPPIVSGVAAWSFEQRRWQESDYAPRASSGDDDDE